jgi:transposase InsO family protein
MDARVQFIADWLSGDYTKIDLCEAYEISRPTGDKWIHRYEVDGAGGLKERSRAPTTRPNAVTTDMCDDIVAMKLAHQHWGPKKVMDRLRDQQSRRPWPADSTAGEILKRAGLVMPRRRRRRVAPDTQPFGDCQQPNQTWSADFKGDFHLGNGQRCYPLTISDNCSRYLLQCRGLARTTYAAVRPWFEWVFREYGLPVAIRTDNGAPFASLALGGITRLSVWWIRLGIKPERIRPGKPQENGRHERMHRSLELGGVHPIQTTRPAQQRQFDVFEHEFNWERSHEALARQTPGSVYHPSPRPYPAKLPPVEYDTDCTTRRVRRNGEIKWRGQHLYISAVLAKEPIGLKAVDDGLWQICYCSHILGRLDERTNTITPAQGWHGTK